MGDPANDIIMEKVDCFFCNMPMILDDFGGVVRVNGEFKFFCNRERCIMEFDRRTKDNQSTYTKPIKFTNHQKRDNW